MKELRTNLYVTIEKLVQHNTSVAVHAPLAIQTKICIILVLFVFEIRPYMKTKSLILYFTEP